MRVTEGEEEAVKEVGIRSTMLAWDEAMRTAELEEGEERGQVQQQERERLDVRDQSSQESQTEYEEWNKVRRAFSCLDPVS